MRTDFGRVYQVAQLAFAGQERPETAPAMDHRLTDAVAMGADVRVLFQDLRQSKPRVMKLDHFFMMQGAFYLSADLWDAVSLYIAPALYGADALMYEGAVIWRPWEQAYLKVGRFVPVYGYKLDNHTYFTRKQTGFGAKSKEVGLEAGVELGPLQWQLSLFNGVESDLDYDDNTAKGLSTRLSLRHRSRGVRLEAGASAFYNVRGLKEAQGGGDTRREDARVGLFGGLALGRLTWMGEADISRIDDRTEARPIARFASAQELAVLAVDGLDLAVTYELWDDDMDASGNAVHRFGAGFDVYPWPFTELNVRYRFTRADARHPMATLSEIMVIAHAFF